MPRQETYILRAGDYFLLYTHLHPSDDYPELCKNEDKIEFIRKTQTIESLEEKANTGPHNCYHPIKKILSILLEIISKHQKDFINFKHLKSSIKLSDLLSDSLPSLSFIESYQLKTLD